MEQVLSWLLRGGVVFSLATVLLGLVMIFVRHPDYLRASSSAADMLKGSSFPRTVSAVLAGLARGEGRSIILLGVFILIATPVLRVALSVVLFAWYRDRKYVLITLIALALLTASFLLGRAE